VLTPGERLRRLDASIRDGLIEKQKIICDIFRLPVEHFNEIVDIAMMPEAPKDSADIALAAYDQVRILTKILNDYMHVSPEREISAVSTAVCDHCHEKDRSRRTTTTKSPPPPLPPPNKQQAQGQHRTPQLKKIPKQKAAEIEEIEVAIHEDDDGYCEIDELRLPAIPTKSPDVSAPLASFKFAVVPPAENTSTSEASKRQSTISVDSIPEESADELQKGESSKIPEVEPIAEDPSKVTQEEKEAASETETKTESTKKIDSIPVDGDQSQSAASTDKSDHIEINDVYDTLVSIVNICIFNIIIYCIFNRLHLTKLTPHCP